MVLPIIYLTLQGLIHNRPEALGRLKNRYRAPFKHNGFLSGRITRLPRLTDTDQEGSESPQLYFLTHREYLLDYS